jgi:hypothetical protein
MKWLLIALSFFAVEVGHAESLKYWASQQQIADKLFAGGQYTDALDRYRRVAEETASPY